MSSMSTIPTVGQLEGRSSPIGINALSPSSDVVFKAEPQQKSFSPIGLPITSHGLLEASSARSSSPICNLANFNWQTVNASPPPYISGNPPLISVPSQNFGSCDSKSSANDLSAAKSYSIKEDSTNNLALPLFSLNDDYDEAAPGSGHFSSVLPTTYQVAATNQANHSLQVLNLNANLQTPHDSRIEAPPSSNNFHSLYDMDMGDAFFDMEEYPPGTQYAGSGEYLNPNYLGVPASEPQDSMASFFVSRPYLSTASLPIGSESGGNGYRPTNIPSFEEVIEDVLPYNGGVDGLSLSSSHNSLRHPSSFVHHASPCSSASMRTLMPMQTALSESHQYSSLDDENIWGVTRSLLDSEVPEEWFDQFGHMAESQASGNGAGMSAEFAQGGIAVPAAGKPTSNGGGRMSRTVVNVGGGGRLMGRSLHGDVHGGGYVHHYSSYSDVSKKAAVFGGYAEAAAASEAIGRAIPMTVMGRAGGAPLAQNGLCGIDGVDYTTTTTTSSGANPVVNPAANYTGTASNYNKHSSRVIALYNPESCGLDYVQLRALLSQHAGGPVRSMTILENSMLIGFFDLRHAQKAMASLNGKSVKNGCPLDFQYHFLRDVNLVGKENNQGTLVVFNLSLSISNTELCQLFGKYGEIKEIRESPNRKHKFVEFYDVRCAEKAMKALNKTDLRGRKIKIEPSRPGGSIRVDRERRGIPMPESVALSGYIVQATAVNGSIPSSTVRQQQQSRIGGKPRRLFEAPSGHHFAPYMPSGGNNEQKMIGAVQDAANYEKVAAAYGGGGGQTTVKQALSPLEMPPSSYTAAALQHHADPASYAHIRKPPSRRVLRDAVPHAGGCPDGSGSFLDGVGSESVTTDVASFGQISGETASVGCSSHAKSRPGQPSDGAKSGGPSLAEPSSLMGKVVNAPADSLSTSVSGGNDALFSITEHRTSTSITDKSKRVDPVAPSKSTLSQPDAPLPGEATEAAVTHAPAVSKDIAIAAAVDHVDSSVVAGPSLACSPIAAASAGRSSVGHYNDESLAPAQPLLSAGGSEAHGGHLDLSKYDIVIDHVQLGQDVRTTLMIKNIPNKYDQDMLLLAVNKNHIDLYDFFYLPIDFKNKCNVGYAFINFIDPYSIPKFYEEFNNKRWEKFNSEKVCKINYARIQGKVSMIDHFKNSSIMYEDLKCRPLIFHSDGNLVGKPEPFPIGVNVRPRSQKDSESACSNNGTMNSGTSTNGRLYKPKK